MEYCFVPNNLKMGGTSCIVTVTGSTPAFSVRWCAEEDYPDKLANSEPKHFLTVRRNGTYYVELTTNTQKIIRQFSVCHLKPASRFAGGDGSLNSPYLISTCAQFIGIRSNLKAHYRLIADLDFEREMRNLCWLPIGSYSQREPIIDPHIPLEDQDLGYRINYGFTGELDGGGHIISGLVCNHPKSKYIGIFGSCGNGAYIHDIIVRNCSFRGGNAYCAGTVAGRAEDVTIERCIIEKTVLKTPSIGGGIIGSGETRVVIRACQFSGILKGELSESGESYADLGGLVGSVGISEIEDCCVKAKITNGMNIAGIISGTETAMIARCFFSGTVEGLYCAGITVGGENSTIQNCVCVGAEICRTAQGPVAVWKPLQIDEGRKEAWQNYAGRIMCDDHTLLPQDNQYPNFCSLSCKLSTLSGECPVVEGTLRDGITISEDIAHDLNFYKGLGWNFETVWKIGADGLPEIKI